MSKKDPITLKEHFLRDLSLEMTRPPLQNAKKGEQELQFTVSLHSAPGANPGFYEVLLASRLVIWHTPTRQPLVVADHAYTGLFHAPARAENGQDDHQMAQQLYPLARESLKQHLAGAGHTPPLPENVDFQQNAKKP